MTISDMCRDRLDPRESLVASQRVFLAGLSPRERARMLAALLAALGINPDAAWRAETGRDRHGWTAAERARWGAWVAGGFDVAAARERCALEFVCWRVCPDQAGTHDQVSR